MQGKKMKKSRFDISAWVVVSAVAVLVVILSMMIFMQFQQRKNQAETLFVEKGTTLIQSFEAGLRGRMDKDEGAFYLQKLLMETVKLILKTMAALQRRHFLKSSLFSKSPLFRRVGCGAKHHFIRLFEKVHRPPKHPKTL